MWFAFKEKPDMRFKFDVTIGGSKGINFDALPAKFHEFVVDKVRYITPSRLCPSLMSTCAR